MHMRGPRDNVLLHGGREQPNMSGLELIDVSLEDDSLLPPTISPPEDKQLVSVLRLSPPVESAPKTPGGRQIPLTGCGESDSKVVIAIPNVPPEENATVPDTVSYWLGCNSSSGPLVAKSTARSVSVQNPQHLTGDMSMKAGSTPTGARSNPWNNSKSAGGHQETVAGPPADKRADGQLVSISSQAEDPPADKPARRQRSKRAIHSLRKSLAWDKAFSTDEGILDGDELPLFTKTPKKLPELPPLDIPQILASVSPAAKFSAVSGTEKPAAEKPDSGTLSAPSLDRTSKAGTLPESSETEASTASRNINALSSSDINVTQSLSSTITSPIHVKPLSAIPRPVTVTQVIEEAVEKGTKLRLPTLVVHPQSKADKCSENALKHEVQSKSQKEAEIVCKYRKESETSVPVNVQKDTQALTRCRSTSSLIKPPSAASSLSKKVSSVSRKVKDTLGRVLPGGMGGRSSANRKALAETAHADRLRPATSASQSSLTGLKVPSSPGPSYMTRSKSARAALSVAPEPYAQKSGVLAELSNKSSSKTSGKHPPGQKKSKGESIWGTLRGKSGSSSTRGNENVVPQSTSIPSPSTLRKTGGTENDGESSKPHNIEASHTDTSRDLPSQIAKPSGLRLPSPKIGFFDSVRTAVSLEKPTVVVPDINVKVRLPPRPPPHGSTSARFAQPTSVDPLLAAAVRCYLSSGIPAAPHFTRGSGKGARKGLIPSASAPASPCKNSEMLSPGTHQAVAGRYLTSRSKFTRVQIEASPERRNDTSGPVRKLTLESSDGKIESDVEKATEGEISFAPVEDEVEVASTVNSLRTDCSMHSADKVVECSNKVTDTAQPSTMLSVVERSNESNGEVSSEHTTGTGELPTLDDASKGTSSGDWSAPVLTASPGGGSDTECLNHLVESLHNSPSIQATFWNLQGSNPPQEESTGGNVTPTIPHGTDPPGPGSVGRQVDGANGGAESCSEGQDRVSELQGAEVNTENISSELAISSSGRDHGRRKSIFGWQDMLAGFSPPAPVSSSAEERTLSQQPEIPVLTCLNEKINSGSSEKLSTPASSRVKTRRYHEPGQIMNGAIIDELRAESFTHEKGRGDKLQSSASTDEKGECIYPAASRAPENDNLQIKLESLFDVNWSGAPVLESQEPASCREESAVGSLPESKGPKSAEKPHLVDSGSLSSTESPQSDTGGRSDGKSPLSVNRALLNTAMDGSRLSITPPLKKERGLFALARSAVSRLTSAASGGLSPRDENSRAIDRDGTGSGSFRKMKKQKLSSSSKTENPLQENTTNTDSVSPSSEGRNVEEELLMRRGGAVQHSPPNKTQPPPNPWSPVKKGQHPGPFDCTKKVAANMLNV